MFTELIIKGESFKLRLDTRNSINLEKALGYNPLNLLMQLADNKMPKKMDVIIMLHSMLQKYHHGYNMDKTMDLFDDYVDDGHNMFDLVPTIVEVLTDAGYLPKEGEQTESDEKN